MATTCQFHDLYAERFDPVMPAVELPKDAPLPGGDRAPLPEIGEADGIIVVHPNWWSAPPAILRGLVSTACFERAAPTTSCRMARAARSRSAC